MKRLIVCADGTWNSAEQKEGDLPIPTNVALIFNSIADFSASGVKQEKYYHPGVGTEGGVLERIAGGVFGEGLGRNIRSAYRWLCENYEDGDHIYLFGFSRGAYTVRSLAGMIGRCSLLDPKDCEEGELYGRVRRLYDECYRKKGDLSAFLSLGWNFHGRSGTDGIPAITIRFIGVWDTVGALGIPDNLAICNIFDNSKHYRFHDTSLGSHIRTARQALALDETRASFSPTLWRDYDENADVRQLWFCGVHSNVGGGYPDRGLSDIALIWMIEEARECGLHFDSDRVSQLRPDFRALIYDSRRGIFSKMISQPRTVPLIARENIGLSLHESVIQRHEHPPLYQDSYRESILLEAGESTETYIYADREWNYTGVYLEKEGVYSFEASGEWLDSTIVCDADGSCRKISLLGKCAYATGTFIGKLEKLFKKSTGNENANFFASRREEEFAWFSLVAVVANGAEPQKDGTPSRHETFLLGKKLERFTPHSDGYLYAFANDAWNFYGNNHGHLNLKITRLS